MHFQIYLARVFVGVEERDDGMPDLVGSGVVGHDEIDDVHGHGAVEPAKDHGVEMEPCGV